MAMTLRLPDDEQAALQKKADEEGRSMHDVARTAIRLYTSDRPQRFAALLERVATEDAEILRRLGE